MSMQSALNTSVPATADSPKGQQAVALFRAQYNKAELDEEDAQNLNEHPGFAAYLAAGIRKFSIKGPVFPVYLECEVGGKPKDELTKELEANGFSVSNWAKDIMGKPAWKPGEKQTVKFGRAAVRELGFTKNPTTAQIWARITELGHSLCEPADGPALRLALKDQPHGDYFWLAMEQISDSGGRPSVFCVARRGGGPWLSSRWTNPGGGWGLGGPVVFRLRK